MLVLMPRGARNPLSFVLIALLLALGCDSDDGKPRDASSHPDAGRDGGHLGDGGMHPDGGAKPDSRLDASIEPPPPMPTFRAHLDGRKVVLDIISDDDLLHDGCEPLLIEKRVGNLWQPSRDERPKPGSPQGYYLDGKFVSNNETPCDEVACEALVRGISARAEEYVQTGTKRPPADAPDPKTLALVVETRPLTGPLRLTAHYFFEGPERCNREPLVATAELTIPIEGVCCPVGPVQCSSPGPGGGWAKSYEQCPGFDPAVGIPYMLKADAHGCPKLVGDETMCCDNCPAQDDAGI